MRRYAGELSACRPRIPLFALIMAAVAAAVGLMTAVVPARSASAADNPYQRGPDPTESGIAAARGPFATAQVSVSRGNGFGGGAIYYPSDTGQGTFGAIAIAPGYSTAWSWYAWLGPRLASHGFVVIGIETNSLTDYADARADQLLAALDRLTTSSPVRDRVDSTRLAVAGHSMGGGGALIAGGRRTALMTAIGMAPYVPGGDLSGLKIPTILFGGQTDTTVTPSYLANAYATIPATTQQPYVEIAGEGHGFPAGGGGGNSSAFARVMMVWMKMSMDLDTRYTPFLCPSLTNMNGISKYQAGCAGSPPGGTPDNGQLVNTSDGRCLDVPNASQTNGTQVALWDCNGQTNQQWNINADGTVTGVQSGLCLDPSSAGTGNGNGNGNGTKIRLWSCSGAANQKWSLRS